MIEAPEPNESPEDFPPDLSADASAKRRHVRAKRVNAMQMWKEGVMDDKPSKERWNREYKDARLKRLRAPTEDFELLRKEVGLVLAVHRRTCEVRLDSAPTESVKAIYRAKVIEELGEFPAVGDRVVLGQTESGDEFSLIQVLPRRSALTRPGPRDRIHQQLTQAANVDQVVIVMTAAQPAFKTARRCMDLSPLDIWQAVHTTACGGRITRFRRCFLRATCRWRASPAHRWHAP